MVAQGDGSNWPSFSPSRLGRVHVDERERERKSIIIIIEGKREEN